MAETLLLIGLAMLTGAALGWWLRGRETPYELRDAERWLRDQAMLIDPKDPSGKLDYAKNGERLALLERAGFLSYAPGALTEYRRAKGWWRRG